MRTFIWSFLYDLNRQYNVEMIELWYRHLRETGLYQGDVYLITNLATIQLPGLEILPINYKLNTHKEVLLRCVMDHEMLPWNSYDAGMCMDTDILAVNDVNPLFATNESLRAARSGMAVLHPRNGGFFVNPIKRRLLSFLSPKARAAGVNGCCFSCLTSSRRETLGEWRSMMVEFGNKPLPPLGDQSFLNWAVYQNRIKVQPYGPSQVVHENWQEHPQAQLWHFPCGEVRLDYMRKFSALRLETS